MMDLPAPVEQSGAETPQEPQEPVLLADGPPTPAPEREREPTLAELRTEVAVLGQRVDALAGSFEAAVRAAVADEVQKVAGELQHTVATLGRVLVRDLGRLNQILAQHRDAIVAELQSPSRPAGESSPGGAAAGPTEAPETTDETSPDEDSGPASDNEKGRNWRRRKT